MATIAIAPKGRVCEATAPWLRGDSLVLLLRNTSVVNMLDGCAISIPCHSPGELPCGLMIWQSAMHDDTVLNIALQAQERRTWMKWNI